VLVRCGRIAAIALELAAAWGSGRSSSCRSDSLYDSSARRDLLDECEPPSKTVGGGEGRLIAP
jgi:hypothetical protein